MTPSRATNVLSIGEIGRIDFRTSRSGESATMSILSGLALQHRYQPARLALGRSLQMPTPPNPVDNLDGRTIRGETLFGQDQGDLGVWVSLIIVHTGSQDLGRKQLRELVAAHWARGAGLIWDSLRGAPDPFEAMIQQIDRARNKTSGRTAVAARRVRNADSSPNPTRPRAGSLI